MHQGRRGRIAVRFIAGKGEAGGIMKLLRSGNQLRPAHHAHHVGYEGSHVMLPLVVFSLMAVSLYVGVRNIDFSELGKTALFYIVMACVALGIAGLFGVVGGWLRSNGEDTEEGFCFIGAVIGAVVFYVAVFT
ncbi:UNVERIFIED_ORG: putative membrane protein YeaQ/YmgE (transglycosylase-associated protein family) [Burkholderia sp. 1595]|uniref:Membrane protein YeaQ/YmgE (Transglycosylase-associated protein family) n=2 Tax=Paraburkholderia terricola TaxID=169427 RepID=A0ABU1LPU2_9BURK|nr:putative membrane protein YeaQ/YmgE (transglycosylase-associated protein family) [Paraburkholderia terricola]MDR6482341.1 putative membrane protein YeaQ/YmgE (transglycosylase-associated protein family) [Paraburkholderia terricola]